MEQQDVNVLVISGSGRSGSTLLHRILGSLDGHVAVGEVARLWNEALPKNGLCGCGVPLRECEFWGAVMQDAFGGFENIDVAHMERLVLATQRPKQQLLHPRLRSGEFNRMLREYSDGLLAIYRSVRKISGCDVIVDSSSAPRHALTLSQTQGLQVHMVHLIRDSRAVAYSWSRKKHRVDVVDHEEYMPQPGVVATARRWNSRQALSSWVSRHTAASTLCRYEDLVADPKESIGRILRDLGSDAPHLKLFVSDREVALDGDHSLWGNPNRFERGVITIRSDMEWQQQMDKTKKRVVTLITFPWLVRYGYLPSRPLPEPAQASPLAGGTHAG